jgi:hypothetical protein
LKKEEKILLPETLDIKCISHPLTNRMGITIL